VAHTYHIAIATHLRADEAPAAAAAAATTTTVVPLVYRTWACSLGGRGFDSPDCDDPVFIGLPCQFTTAEGKHRQGFERVRAGGGDEGAREHC